MPETSEPPLVDPWLGGVDLTGHQRTRIKGHILRVFVALESHAVARPMPDEMSEPRLFEDLSRGLVDRADGVAGDRRLRRSLGGVVCRLEQLPLPLAGLAADPGSLVLDHQAVQSRL